jgi:hypothetical protein
LPTDRITEWFVPKFGPKKFRIGIGILFLPYTAIVTCFAILGAISETLDVQRVVAIGLIYFLALGVSAHILDAIGGKTKPWGDLPRKKLLAIAMSALAIAFAIGSYYGFLDSPLLFPIGILEGFFLFAYNLELFGGKFHNKASTVFSWGILPIFAGSAIQTNSISVETIIISCITAVITYALISTSKPYKILKQNSGDSNAIKKKEVFLKLLTLGVVVATIVWYFIKTMV